MTPEEKLLELGIQLKPPAAPMGSYVPVVVERGFAFVSGHPPAQGGELVYTGRVGEEVSVEEGYQAARLCVINGLGALKAEIGELSRVRRVVQVLGYVNSAAGFGDHPGVVNGASDLLAEVFGDRGVHSRAAVGAPSLPAEISVEVLIVAAVEE